MNSELVTQDQQTFSCAVCGEPAKGYHFGAFTCEGCKSFFGRTCLKKDRLRMVCRVDGRCDVQGENRTSCKACRFTKCLKVGMSPMNSRFGRRSKYFKVSAVLEAQKIKLGHQLDYCVPSSSVTQNPVTFAQTPSVSSPVAVCKPLVPPLFTATVPMYSFPSIPIPMPVTTASTPSIFPPLSMYQILFQRMMMMQSLNANSCLQFPV